ncbi:amidohydrolase 2 [Colletotrichum tofieldiae]|nr:amidohydrolase 2 [Colletotrichum tofieldiae]
MALSPDGWDTHVHVFDSMIGPFASSRSYTPAQATSHQLLDFGSGLTQGHMLNTVLVQPSTYGNDNTVLLHSIKQLRESGSRMIRGIAVVDIDSISDEELRAFHECGIRGLRINKQADGRGADVNDLRKVIVKTAARIRGLRGWKIQLFCAASTWDVNTALMIQPDLYETILTLPVEVIVDHVGGIRGLSKLHLETATQSIVDPRDQAGFDSLLKLAKASKIIIKLSGFYRLSNMQAFGYSDLEPIIRTLTEAVPDRLVWGSDWPHTGEGKDRLNRGIDFVEGFRDIDDGGIVENIRKWINAEDVWTRIFVVNPNKVYE